MFLRLWAPDARETQSRERSVADGGLRAQTETREPNRAHLSRVAMADHGPISPSGPGSSKFRDVTRTVSTEAATHLDRLKKSERTKQVVDKTVDWTAEALEDVEGTANRLKAQASKLWSEDEKVKAFRDRTREMVENALEDEEKMQRVRLPRSIAPPTLTFSSPPRSRGGIRATRAFERARARPSRVSRERPVDPRVSRYDPRDPPLPPRADPRRDRARCRTTPSPPPVAVTDDAASASPGPFPSPDPR